MKFSKEDSMKIYQEVSNRIDMEKLLRDYLIYGEAIVEVKDFDVEGFLIENRDW